MIKGMTVILLSHEQSGTDDFGAPVYTDQEISVDDVLVSPSASEDIVDTMNLTGKKAVYTLCIPKKDNHDWENKTVVISGKKYRTIGQPQHYIPDNVPLRWNDKIEVENYE